MSTLDAQEIDKSSPGDLRQDNPVLIRDERLEQSILKMYQITFDAIKSLENKHEITEREKAILLAELKSFLQKKRAVSYLANRFSMIKSAIDVVVDFATTSDVAKPKTPHSLVYYQSIRHKRTRDEW